MIRSRTVIQSSLFGVVVVVGAVIIGILLLGVITDESYFNLFQFALNGVLVGGIYALVALGIVIINKASGIFNFSHGLMMLFGGLMFWQTFNAVPSLELSIILGGLAGITLLNVMANDPDAVISDKTLVQRTVSTITSPRFLGAFSSGLILAGILVFLLQQENFDTPRRICGVIGGTVGAGLLISTISTDLNSGIPVENTQHQIWRIVTNTRFIIGMFLVGLAALLLLVDIRDDIIRGTLGGVIGSMTLGLLVERFTIRPLLGQPTLASIMMTLAVALVLQGTISLIWGPQPKSLPVFVEIVESKPTLVPIGIDNQGNTIYTEIPGAAVPPKVLPNYELPTDDLLGNNLSLPRNLVWGFGIAIISFLTFVLFFQFTSTGLAMRAVAENQTLAESMGLQVRTILALAWAIATTMAMVAAVIQGTGPAVGLGVLVVPPLAFRAFPAVLLGGLESITGALVGGLIIGVVETLATGLINSTTGQEFAPFAVMLVVLLIRPDGLFGQRRIDRV